MIKNIIIFISLLLFCVNSQLAAQGTTPNCTPQNPYVQKHDGSGNKAIDPTQLNAKAIDLAGVFPEPFCSAFKVYDYGFTPILQYTKGGYAEDFEAMKVASMGPLRDQPYLLFAKEVDAAGKVIKIWVDVNLPDKDNFACLKEMQRSLIKIRVEKATNDALQKNINSPLAMVSAEIMGMDKLREEVIKIIKCCINKVRENEDCACNDEILNETLTLQNFQSLEVMAIKENTSANIKTDFIIDNSNFKLNIDNSNDYVGNILSGFIIEINSLVSVNLLVRNKKAMCDNNFIIENFIKEKDLLIEVIFDDEKPEITTKMKTFWNYHQGSWLNNQELANEVIEKLECKITNILKINKLNCFSENVACHTLKANKEIENNITIEGLSAVEVTPTTGIPIGGSRRKKNINNDPNFIPEDMKYGINDGDGSGIRYADGNLTKVSDEWLFLQLKELVYITTLCNVDQKLRDVAFLYVDHFKKRSGSMLYNLELSKKVAESVDTRNYIKNVGRLIQEQVVFDKVHSLNKYNMKTLDMREIRPIYNGKFNRFNGLQILLNDTEETKMWLLDFKYDYNNFSWYADLYIEIYDNFGLDRNDAITYQGNDYFDAIKLEGFDGFAAWWTLQHRRNYTPFKTLIKLKTRLSGTFKS